MPACLPAPLLPACLQRKMTLLKEATVGGGALELEDLAGVVGAVGLLAAIGDEFVGGGGRGGDEGSSAGKALRACLSDMARDFFQGANKVRDEA